MLLLCRGVHRTPAPLTRGKRFLRLMHAFHMNYSVADLEACISVGYEKNGFIRHTLYIRQHPRFGLLIERARRFVKQQDRSVCQQCSGNGYSLNLPFRQPCAPFRKMRFKAVGQGCNIVLDFCSARSPLNLLIGHRAVVHRYVFPNRTRKHHIPLRNIGKKSAQGRI